MRYLSSHLLTGSLIFLTILNQHVVCSTRHTCSLCTCHNTSTAMVFVDCRSRNLTTIPNHLPPNTSCLDLGGNYIRSIATADRNPLSHLRNLSVLSLSDNLLNKITANDFVNLKKLRKLDLSLNHIRYENIAGDAFDEVPNLLYLDIKQDFQNQSSREHFAVKALRKLKKLRTLVVDIANTVELGEEFRHLTSLEELYLSGTYGYCEVPSVTKSFFHQIRLPESGYKQFHLYMSNCSIRNIEKGALKPLRHLTTLDISWNKELTFDPLHNVTEDIMLTHKDTIRFLNLNAIHDLTTCTKLQNIFIRPLRDTTMEIISLESNYIISIEEDALYNFPRKLKYISIRDNMFLWGAYLQYMTRSGMLNNLVYFDTGSMYKSHIQILPPELQQPTPMQTSFLNSSTRNTFCSGLDSGSKNNCCDAMLKRNNEKDFAHIILGRVSTINDTTRAIGNVSTVQESSYKHNGSSVSQLLYLDVSENQPDTVNFSISLFTNLTHLLFLNMSMNLYGYIYFSKENASLFSSTKQLTVLDMSANRILSMWPDTFKPLTNLEKLYLSNNQLTSVHFELGHTKKLTYLDLSTNRIETIPKAHRDSLTAMPNLSIDLSNNMMKCSCSDLNFIEWIQTGSTVVFINSDNYQCKSDHGTSMYIKDIVLSEFHNSCFPRTYSTLILSLSLSLVTFVLVVVGGLIYRYKWNLRYLYYMTKYKMFGGYMLLRNEENEFDKDIFVSYANEDSNFVRYHVLPQLQENGDFSLLIHERDFEAGQYVADNIMKAVSTTRRTLSILTRNYIRSKWCRHEINMARLQGIDTGKEILCVILKEDIPLKSLPLEIMDIIKKKTYLEYPHREEYQAQFWERLKETLKR